MILIINYYFKVDPQENYVNAKLNISAGLAAKGIQEDDQDILCDSATCNKESMYLFYINCIKEIGVIGVQI